MDRADATVWLLCCSTSYLNLKLLIPLMHLRLSNK